MPVIDQDSLELISRSAEHTLRAGMRLGALLLPGDLVCRIGELGSGKTTLVQGISAGWGSLDAASSPTFVLVNVYRRPEADSLFHVDAYRLIGAQEAVELDLEEMLARGPMIVEWADRILQVLPNERLVVTLKWVDENQGDIIFSAQGLVLLHI